MRESTDPNCLSFLLSFVVCVEFLSTSVGIWGLLFWYLCVDQQINSRVRFRYSCANQRIRIVYPYFYRLLFGEYSAASVWYQSHRVYRCARLSIHDHNQLSSSTPKIHHPYFPNKKKGKKREKRKRKKKLCSFGTTLTCRRRDVNQNEFSSSWQESKDLEFVVYDLGC